MKEYVQLRTLEYLFITCLFFSGGALIKINQFYLRLDVISIFVFCFFVFIFTRNKKSQADIFGYPLVLLSSIYMSSLINCLENSTFSTSMIHDLCAYLINLILIFFILKAELDITKLLKYAVILITITAFLCSFFNFFYSGYFYTDDLTTSYNYGNRFSFLSYNPNQIAQVILVIPFIFFYTCNRRNFKELLATILLCSISIYLGYITRSRALYISWIISQFVFFALYFYKNETLTHLKLAALSFLGALVLCFLSYLYYKFVYTPYDETTHRLTLLSASLNVIMENPIWGLGAGPHVSLSKNSFAYVESHNSFLDLLTQGGLIGLSIYLFILFKIFKKIKDQSVLLCMFIGLLTFSFFHLTFRHPIYWILMIWLYQGGEKNHSSRQAGSIIHRDIAVYSSSHLAKID